MKDKFQAEARSDFERDFDRVVFSPAFRRLQGKTQVFPLPESDMTHTRLTHSLETSCVGRSLGTYVGRKLKTEGHDIIPSDLGAIVAAASLAHDIGNPPFGHSGERAIGVFFSRGAGADFIKDFEEHQKLELANFEGNALGFRLLTNQKPAQTTNKGGFTLTYATLAAFSKYPCAAQHAQKKGAVWRKKYGFFHDDRDSFAEVADGCALGQYDESGWKRHPLAFLTEAADDICYRIIDLEDGYKLKLVSFDETSSLLMAIAHQTSQDVGGLSKIVAEDHKIAFLRAKAMNSLIEQLASEFLRDIAGIGDGTRERPLFDAAAPKDILEQLERISRGKIYSHRPVVEIEAAGFEVMGALLEAFLRATMKDKGSDHDAKVRQLVPMQYLPVSGSAFSPQTQLLNICEYVASMTDSYAIDTYRMLRGISLPNYRP